MRIEVGRLCRWHPTAPVEDNRCARCGCAPWWMLVVDRGAERLAHEDRVLRRPFETKADADGAAAMVRWQHESGRLADRGELSLGEFLDEVWLPTVRDRVGASTWHSYRSELHRHIIRRLGDARLEWLKSLRVRTPVAATA